jgi:hypothetical protein
MSMARDSTGRQPFTLGWQRISPLTPFAFCLRVSLDCILTLDKEDLMVRTITIVAVTLAGGLAAVVEEKPACPTDAGYPLQFSDNFESGLDRWEFTDPDAWKVADAEGGNKLLALHAPSKYRAPVRSPQAMARVKELKLGSFVLEVKAEQTGREYGHRDLCFFFGYQDPSHFYYVHLASVADEHANSIFLVDGAPRVSIAKERTDGTDWTQGFHTIRIVRDVESGLIEVYFDDMDKPVMSTEDKTFLHGTVGLGSFDDVGNFDDLYVWGEAAE